MMNKKLNSRRLFLKTGLAATGILSFNNLIIAKEKNNMKKNMFVHHVYFWLQHPGNKEDLAKLVNGLEALSKVETIKMFHIGQPADTNREVIDRSYAVSWLCIFENAAAQESYQSDPIHLKFVAECSSLWSKVVVYDAVDI
ncbi:MAG: Dabb family protein [Chitinophagaceae bacterium]